MKKLLALVLALVMTLGLATVGASAATTIKDKADVEYTEAVEVMNGIGVIVGDENGNFNPKDTLTREQAAKIVAYMKLGQAGADGLSASATPFTDVAADRWSAGAIAYCYTEGIIAGLGDGTFNPTGKLTGHQFAKMLLVALGYDSKLEGFEGTSDWAINVAKMAQTAGLIDDLNIVMSADMTRDQAAKMSFNTLVADLVYYESGVNVKTGDGTEVTLKADRHKCDDIRGIGNNYDGRDDGGVADVDKFCELYFPNLRKTTVVGSFGDLTNSWNIKGVEISSQPQTADAVLTGHITRGALYTAVGAAAIKNPDDINVWVDGVHVANADPFGLATASGSSNTLPTPADGGADAFIGAGILTGYGTTLKVYNEWDANAMVPGWDITIVIQHTFVGKVSAVTEASGSSKRSVTITPKTQPAGLINGAFDDVGGDPVNLTLDGKFETEEFAKGDIVLYTAKVRTGTDKIQIKSAKLATAVSGVELTKLTESRDPAGKPQEATATVGGTDYHYNLRANHADNFEVGNKYDLYLDEQGAIIYTTLAEETLNLEKYIVLTLADKGGTTNSTTVMANAITLAGTKLNDIKISKLDSNSVNSWDNGTVTQADDVQLFRVYEAKVDSAGAYELKTVGGNYASTAMNKGGVATVGDFTYTTGSASLNGIAGATDATTLYLYDLGDKNVTTYTGMKNFPIINPALTATDFGTANGIVKDGTGTDPLTYDLSDTLSTNGIDYTATKSAATFLVKDGIAIAGVLCVNDRTSGILGNTTSADDIIYVASKAYSTSKVGDTTIYTFDVIKAGKLTTISTEVVAVRDLLAANQGLYLIKGYDGEKVSSLESGAAPVNTAGLDALADYAGNDLSNPYQPNPGVDTWVAFEDHTVNTYGVNVDVKANTFTLQRLADNAGNVATSGAMAVASDCVFYEISTKGEVTELDKDTIGADFSKADYHFIIEQNAAHSDIIKAVFVQKT